METIERDLNASLVLPSGQLVPLEARLEYHELDPLGVRMDFRVGEGVCRWILSRDLLIEGLSRRAGAGDVKIWPLRRDGEQRLRILLVAPSGEALVDASAVEVTAFLDQTLDRVAKGQEVLEIDALIARILRRKARPM
ncbi:SsgA family sporulation/cell division regulator [Streptacidiphilus anmyonensis]|uniref:SsgA family sporulation/cell division regulator n=1 Tax=Streptacidiphilus anmyonensis TaxID=405782 RepID=UPI0005A5D33E|nr:SsgA family sporulation/cell division regulator [Streptacidiphilus anmyonensis]